MIYPLTMVIFHIVMLVYPSKQVIVMGHLHFRPSRHKGRCIWAEVATNST